MLSLTALAACLACADAHRDAHSYWTQPPVGWFGGNATHFENASQLEAIGKYNIAIFGWQHLIFATNWTASVYAQLSQAAILKAQQPHMSVYVYAGFANADGYNAATWEIIRSASDGCHGHQPCRKVAAPYTDWVLETDTTPVYSMSACEQMGLGYSNPPTFKCWNPIWNVANASMRDFFIEHVIAPLAAAPPTMVDGVFFDCFNEAYNMPTPWNRRATNIPNCTTGTGGSGCEALLAGTIDLARRVALTLNAGGKTPMFSNVGSFVNPKAGAPFWLDEGRLLDALDGTSFQLNYESVRAEKVPTPRFQPTTLQNFAHLWMCSSPCMVQLASSGMLPNMLEEARRGVRVGFHVYLKAADEDVTPHLAAFLVVRAEGWLFFASTGWVDDDWRWQATAHTVPALATAVVHSSHVPCPVRALCGAGGRQSMTRWANAANRRVPLPACPRRSRTAASTRAARPCSTARARRARMQGTRIPSAARG